MIKSELIQRIFSQNPHLYQRDIENIVNAIIDEIVKALGRGDRVELRDFGVFQPRFADRARGAIPRPALKCRSHKKSSRSSRPEKKCARGLIRKLTGLLVKHSLSNPHTFWFRHCQRHRQRFGRHGEHEERRGETSRPWRIRKMGEKAPQRREDDGRLSLLPILTERKVGSSRFPCG